MFKRIFSNEIVLFKYGKIGLDFFYCVNWAI